MGHNLRRLLHISSIFVPFFYFQYEKYCYKFNWLPNPQQILILILLLIHSLESLRLDKQWIIVGQRSYEKNQISGLTWGVSFSFLVLLTVKTPAIGFAIIGCYAIVDPLIGEMRRASYSFLAQYFWGWISVTLIWIITVLIGNLSIWLIVIIPPVTIAAEKVWFIWFDDNALMQLFPLIIIWLAGL